MYFAPRESLEDPEERAILVRYEKKLNGRDPGEMNNKKQANRLLGVDAPLELVRKRVEQIGVPQIYRVLEDLTQLARARVMSVLGNRKAAEFYFWLAGEMAGSYGDRQKIAEISNQLLGSLLEMPLAKEEGGPEDVAA